MNMPPRRARNPREAGFTVIEVLIASVIGFIVVLAAYQLLISQSELLTQHRELIDARDSARGGAALLAWELKTAAASGNDLYVISADSVVLRSVQATGLICSWTTSAGNYRFGLRNTSGSFTGTADDSAMVFYFAENPWRSFDVTGAWNGAASWLAAPTGGGTPVCFWGDSTATYPRPEATVELAGTGVDTVKVGAPVHVFRRTKYGLSQSDGRWWLSRKVGAGAWEILTGPMLSPTDGGLTFTYYDANDVVTADPTLVSRVEFTLRAESYRQLVGGAVGDSITMTVFLRNNL